jgi:hypothetical protein
MQPVAKQLFSKSNCEVVRVPAAKKVCVGVDAGRMQQHRRLINPSYRPPRERIERIKSALRASPFERRVTRDVLMMQRASERARDSSPSAAFFVASEQQKGP